MTELQAIYERHSVRKYIDKPIEESLRNELNECCSKINELSGLNISIVYDDKDGFDSRLARYGSFENVGNFIVLSGKDSDDFEEKVGYYGEMLVIKAQTLGLNTCWAALTYNKKKVKKHVKDGDRFSMVIALGYGQTKGSQHRGKALSDITTSLDAPEWFIKGAEAALLAPTAINQQKFKIELKDGKPVFTTSGFGVHTRVDLGIIMYHFDVAAGTKSL